MKNSVHGYRLLVAALAAGVVFAACGETYTWIGGGAAGNWNDSANWDPSTGTPGAGDRAEFNDAGTFAISSGIALGEGTLTIKLGSGVTNTISGAISGAGGIRVEGSCTKVPSASAQVANSGRYVSMWQSAMIFSGANSYAGGTVVTNAMLRGDTTTAFGAADTDVLFCGYGALWLNASGTWESYKYAVGKLGDIGVIRFMQSMEWNGTLTQDGNASERSLYLCVPNGKGIDMRGTINLPNIKVYPSLGTPSVNSRMNFYNPVIVKAFCQIGAAGIGAPCYFYATGNRYEYTQVGYGFNVYCMAERLLDETRVLNWGGKYGTVSTGWFDLNGHDQQAKGLTSTKDTKDGETDYCENGNFLGSRKKGSSATMYLVGATQNCLFRGLVTNAVSIVWDPAGSYTQTFSNRVHAMTGSFTVSNGTIRIAGAATFKNVPEITVCSNASFECFSSATDCLAGLKRLVIEDGATFTVGANTPKPFTDGEIDLVVKGTGRIVMPDGMSVTMKTAYVNGIYPTGDTAYGSSEGWIGGGEVRVVNAGITSWKTAASGSWNNPANWTAGVPDGPGKVYITAPGGDYTVTFDGNATLGTALEIGNDGVGTATLSIQAVAGMTNGFITIADGGRMTIPDGGSLEYCGKGGGTRAASSSTAIVSVTGGELAVSGGSVDFDEMGGRVLVAQGVRTKGRITLSGGSIRHLPDTNSDEFLFADGGCLDMTGGTFNFDYRSNLTYTGLRLKGGELYVSSGTFGPVAKGSTHDNDANLYFNRGKAVFTGDAILRLPNKTGTFFDPEETASDLTFRIEGNAVISPANRVVEMGHQDARGTIALDWLTSGMNSTDPVAYRTNVGRNCGNATMNISNAVYNAGAEGVFVAIGRQDDAYRPAQDVYCELNVKDGGVLRIDGSSAHQTGYSKVYMQGLVVGYTARTGVTSGYPYNGTVNVESGAFVTNMYGDVGIGVGHATGRLVVNGGTFRNNDHSTVSAYDYWNRVFGVGLFGGIGTCVLTNGATFSSRPDVYVGGAVTNLYRYQGSQFFPYSKLPSDHSATGTLVVADADVTLRRNLILGMDGFGVVRREGSQGTFTAGNLVCTNIEDAAYTGSRLDFVFDANGIGSLDVTNAVSIFGNAKVTVDMSAYAGKKRSFKLIGCKSRSGDFDEMTVTGVNRPNCNPVVEWTPKGLYLKMRVGMVMSFR